MKKPDHDIKWALDYIREDAEACSIVNGPYDESTMEVRRLETTFKRLAREAGYDVDTHK